MQVGRIIKHRMLDSPLPTTHQDHVRALEKVTPYLLKADLVEKAKAKVLEKATPYLEKAKVLKKADDLEKAKVQPKKKVVPYLAGTRRSAGSGTSDAGRNSSRAHSTTHPFSFGAADAGGGHSRHNIPYSAPTTNARCHHTTLDIAPFLVWRGRRCLGHSRHNIPHSATTTNARCHHTTLDGRRCLGHSSHNTPHSPCRSRFEA